MTNTTTNSNKKLKWAAIQPLIGGMGLGGEKAFGHRPEFILSWTGCWANEEPLLNYWDDMKDKYFMVDDPDGLESNEHFTELNDNIDVVVGVPVCSALSSLNPKSSAEYGSVQNIYDMATLALETIKPQAYIFENAPALYTKKGEPVLKKLKEFGVERGYSSSIVYTDTEKHGVPQHRKRTFFIFWKGLKNAPIMDFYNRERKSVVEYLKDIPKEAKHQDQYCNNNILTEMADYKYAVEKWGKNFRHHMKEEIGVCTFVATLYKDPSLFPEVVEYFKEHGNDKEIHYITHAQKKHANNGGVWHQGFVSFGTDTTNACQGRVLNNAIHPVEDRFINVREWMHLMGLPHDFNLVNEKKFHIVSQNVPVQTACDWITETIKFCNGELHNSQSNFVRQHNVNQTTDVEQEQLSLDDIL